MPITYSQNPFAANLSWTIRSAPNQNGFAVRKSADGVSFQVLGLLPMSQPSFKDLTAVPGETAYYEIDTLYGSNVVKVTAPAATTPPIAASPDGTAVPPAAQIVDAAGDTWTLAGTAILKNGAPAANGAGSEITWAAGKIGVLGTDSNRYEWDGTGWVRTAVVIPPSPGITPLPPGKPTIIP